MRDDKSCLSYWFPRVAGAGLPVPKTILMTMPRDAAEDIWRLFDGQQMTGAADPFFKDLRAIGDIIGYPCFLRTGQTSGKHNWKETCFVQAGTEITDHVLAIAEFSEMADLLGLPWHLWAVREFLPTMPLTHCPNYGDMPVCREFRAFIRDEKVVCWHPYWPRQVLEEGGAKDFDFEELCRCDQGTEMLDLASAAGRAVGGEWSVDLLETKRGWYLTDMAEADRSFHWEGCDKT